MKRYVVISLLIVLPFAFPVLVSPQIPAPEKAVAAALCRKNGSANWAEPNKEAFLAGARRGDAGAQFWLGEAYEQGLLGNAPDFRAALEWLRKSAVQGNPDAQNEVGRMYEKGEGVTRDYVAAAAWYRKAAEHVPDLGGASQGRNNLAMLYINGLGVPRELRSGLHVVKPDEFQGEPGRRQDSPLFNTSSRSRANGRGLEAPSSRAARLNRHPQGHIAIER